MSERTPEQEAIYQQFLSEAREVILEGNRKLSEVTGKETIFCGPGCSTCCNQLFFIHPVAFEVVLQRIETDPLLRKRFEENNTLRNELIKKNQSRVDELLKNYDHHEWLKLRIPCSLLFENKCMIYDIRPFICAAYITLSPPRVCAIDPKGYRPTSLTPVLHHFYQLLLNLQVKYDQPGEALFDISMQLDRRLNPPSVEKKKRKKEQ